MVAIKYDCPFCRSREASFNLIADFKSSRALLIWASVGQCGVCNEYAIFITQTGSQHLGPTQDEDFRRNPTHRHIYECIPAPTKPRIPENIPENVMKPLLEAEASFAAGHYSAAASCFRKAMERSLKHINPDAKGMLNKRIRDLEQSQRLPHEMIELLDQVRIFGNASMHEDDFDPNKDDCSAARDFSNLFLTYAFTLPGMISAAKQKNTDKMA